jgi:hypothetical protein
MTFQRNEIVMFNRGTYGAKTYKARIADVDQTRKFYVVFVNEGKPRPAVYNIPFDDTSKIQKA